MGAIIGDIKQSKIVCVCKMQKSSVFSYRYTVHLLRSFTAICNDDVILVAMETAAASVFQIKPTYQLHCLAIAPHCLR